MAELLPPTTMHKRVTIKDVAREAGVSKVTVSYVLNGQGETARISEKTRERVLRVAKELRYTPSAIARSMVTKRSDTLGVVFQFAPYFASRSDFTTDVMLGVSQEAVSAGYDLMLHTKPVLDALAEVAALTDGRVDGVLILRDAHDEALDLLIRQGFPCVLFFTRSTDPTVAFVDADNVHGGRLAAEHLLGLGHRRVGMLCGSPRSTSAMERLKGFRDALKERGVVLDERHLLHPVAASEAEAIEDYLRSPDRPTGIFCFSDEFAFLACRIATKLGIMVPQQLSIVGFDSLEACEHSHPPLTSIRQPVVEMARAATQMLVKVIRKEPINERQEIFRTVIDVRGSTAPPAD